MNGAKLNSTMKIAAYFQVNGIKVSPNAFKKSDDIKEPYNRPITPIAPIALSEADKLFIAYLEQERTRQRMLQNQLLYILNSE